MEQFVAHPLIKKINFTSSTRVGRIIAATTGKHLKPVLMELGGKASAIVFADADLDKAVMHCAMGAYSNHGQICMSTERIFVHESIVDKFEAMFVAKVRRLFKNQQDTPKLITAAAAQRCRDHAPPLPTGPRMPLEKDVGVRGKLLNSIRQLRSYYYVVAPWPTTGAS